MFLTLPHRLGEDCNVSVLPMLYSPPSQRQCFNGCFQLGPISFQFFRNRTLQDKWHGVYRPVTLSVAQPIASQHSSEGNSNYGQNYPLASYFLRSTLGHCHLPTVKTGSLLSNGLTERSAGKKEAILFPSAR